MERQKSHSIKKQTQKKPQCDIKVMTQQFSHPTDGVEARTEQRHVGKEQAREIKTFPSFHLALQLSAHHVTAQSSRAASTHTHRAALLWPAWTQHTWDSSQLCVCVCVFIRVEEWRSKR